MGSPLEKAVKKIPSSFSLLKGQPPLDLSPQSPSTLIKNMKVGMPLPLLQYRDKDYGRRWPFGQIPAALRHPLIKNLKVGEQAGIAAVRLHFNKKYEGGDTA
jgi:hypothetical protein